MGSEGSHTLRHTLGKGSYQAAVSLCVSNRKWEYSGVNKCDSAPLMLSESLSVYMPR